MTQEEFDKAPLLDQILYDTTGMLVENHPSIAEAMDKYHQAKLKLLSIADVSGMLSDQTKRHIDFAYLTGVFNVSGIDGLQKELTRLKEIGKNPHDIFSEGNYR